MCEYRILQKKIEDNLNDTITAHSHKMETSQMETIPYMETFLIYQTAYYIKQGGFGNFFFSKVP